MKKLITFLGDTLLISAASFFTIFAVISSYSLNADISFLIRAVIIGAAFVSLLCTLMKSYGFLIAVPVFAILLQHNWPDVLSGAKFVLYDISFEFSEWFPIIVIFRDSVASLNEITMFFTALSFAIILLTGLSICVLRSPLFTILFTLPVAAISLIFINLPPNPLCFLELIAVYLVMLISASPEKKTKSKSGAAVFPALALTVILMTIAYFTAGDSAHTRSDFVLRMNNNIMQAATKYSSGTSFAGVGWPEANIGGWQFNTYNVDVSGAGKRSFSNVPLLDVTFDKAGFYYLYGYSMTYFNGWGWTDISDNLDIEKNGVIQNLPMTRFSQYCQKSNLTPNLTLMTIEKRNDLSDIEYMPYYPYAAEHGSVYFCDVKQDIFNTVNNEASLESLSFSVYNSSMQPYYTQIDDYTAEALREIAANEGIYPAENASIISEKRKVAESVAEFISSSAQYTLSPPVTPAEDNFALFFLNQSKRGYCIHFATTATLMLRALDIPARFVSGFIAAAPEAGQKITLTDRNAHSWVEVYYENLGWIPLEVTPESALTNEFPDFDFAAYRNVYNPVITEVPVETALDSEPIETTKPQNNQPTPTPGKSGQSDDEPDSSKLSSRIFVFLFSFAGVVIICLVLFIRQRITHKLRHQLFSYSDTNSAVIAAWRYINRLHIKKESIPAVIEELALKARFSQHRITAAEREAIINYAFQESDRLYNEKSVAQRLIMKYIYTLY